MSRAYEELQEVLMFVTAAKRWLYGVLSLFLQDFILGGCKQEPGGVLSLALPFLPFSFSSSFFESNNGSFRHASPRLRNELPKELCQPVDDESLSLSSHISLTGLSSSPSLSPLSLCITPSLFHSRLKTYLFHKSSLHRLPHLLGRISRIFMTISGLNCTSFFLLFCSFHLFCLIRVID